MKPSFSLCIWSGFFCLLANAALASAPNRTEFEQQFIGKTWKSETLRLYPLSSECMRTEGFVLQQDAHLIVSNFACTGDRQLGIISEQIGLGSLRLVLDAFLFPQPKEGEQLLSTGQCSLNGETLTDFTALVRMGSRESVDWQTGVLQAWIPNVVTKKYEPLSTRHIVCETPTPP